MKFAKKLFFTFIDFLQAVSCLYENICNRFEFYRTEKHAGINPAAILKGCFSRLKTKSLQIQHGNIIIIGFEDTFPCGQIDKLVKPVSAAN